MKFDYGQENRGFSYEYVNLYGPLQDVLGTENVQIYDFYTRYKSLGKTGMNAELLATVKEEKPDVTLFCLFEEEFDEKIVSELKSYTKTIAYFFDDPWRQKFVRKWIKHFDWFSTPDYYMYQTYLMEGIKNVIHSPFGFNENLYKRKPQEMKYDVSFVGGFNPLRAWVIKYLNKHGIKTAVFGRGWGDNYSWVTTEGMVDVFNSSRINLNISNSISYEPGYLLSTMFSVKGLKGLLLNQKNKEQVKGRHYEINGCGGFQLSYFVPGLNMAYSIDKEIAVYEDIRHLPEAINFFLANNKLREEIANAGYERSIKDHKAQEYLKKLLQQVTGKQL